MSPAPPNVSMTLSGPRLRELATHEADGLAYVRGSMMQVSPTQVALFAALKVKGHAVVDFAGGTDVIVFDDLDQVRPERAQPVMRNEPAVHPRTGSDLIMVKHLVMGGFVPLGATLADGRAHPHAGTGFGLATCVGYPAALDNPTPHVGADVYRYHELQQYRFDGERFEVLGSEKFDDEGPLPGHRVSNRPLTSALMDGEDLIAGLVAGPVDSEQVNDRGGAGHGSGFARWCYGAQGWRPVSFVAVSGPDMAFEPSMVCDTDGSLLFAVRGRGSDAPPGEVRDGVENTYEHFRVWRSMDHGETWQRVIHLKQQRAPSPVVLDQTIDGWPVLTANPYVPLQQDSRGRTIMATRQRSRLCLWPLTVDRTGVHEPVVALDANAMFGPPRPTPDAKHDNLWYVDHPIGGVYRLGDGQRHSLVCFRVGDAAQMGGGAEPTEHSGCWIERILTG